MHRFIILNSNLYWDINCYILNLISKYLDIYQLNKIFIIINDR